LAIRGVPRLREAISRAASGRMRIERIFAERSTIRVRDSVS
jgi:hypothetical protein